VTDLQDGFAKPLAPIASTVRSHRVKLLGSVLAIIQLNDESVVRARMHQLSARGGVLQLSDALLETSHVRLMFRLGSTTLRTEAEMLPPMWSTRGFLQPFRFLALREPEQRRLQQELERLIRPAVPAPVQPSGTLTPLRVAGPEQL
jgi:hypothetical protein